MNCKNCGAPLQDNAAFCGNCGMKAEAEQPVYEAPAETSGEYTAETYSNVQEQGSYTPVIDPVYNEPVYSGERPNTVLWIVLSAIETFLCCTVSGVIGLIFSILGHVAAEKGDFADAAQKIKYAKISFWVGLALSLVFWVCYILFMVVLGVGTAGIIDGSYYFY